MIPFTPKWVWNLSRSSCHWMGSCMSICHLMSISWYLFLELFDKLITSFFNPALSDWYSEDSGVAKASGSDINWYLNALVRFSALLTSKPKPWQSSFKTDKIFNILFFFPFPIFNLSLQIGSKNDFLPFTNLSWRNPWNVCF